MTDYISRAAAISVALQMGAKATAEALTDLPAAKVQPIEEKEQNDDQTISP